MTRPRLGVWLIGALGGVATTTTLGLVALSKGLAGPQGLASQLSLFSQLDLRDWDELVIGGHEIRSSSLVDEARKLASMNGALNRSLVDACEAELRAIDRSILPGTLFACGATIENLASRSDLPREETPRGCISRIQHDLKTFATTHALDRIVVVNVASTEPPIEADALPPTWEALKSLLNAPSTCPLAASSLYAIAALELGYAYVNFTPSLGSTPSAICELAQQARTCHMGQDGKTGETLLKSALAPMFARRNLEVMSWVGHNIFGNLDGKVLDDPVNKQSKVATKDRLLPKILGYEPQTLVSIEYIESLGDWKTAWDHIHFRGFLGTPMAMQFTWQGCDSLLAAPLVIDLVRFTDLASRRGHTGLMPFLSCFFKSPLGVAENNFERQFQMLEAWSTDIGSA